MKQEPAQDIVRLAKQGGPIRDALLLKRDEALDSFREGLRTAGLILDDEIATFIYNSGWLSNCDTVDDFIRRIVARYPWLRECKPKLVGTPSRPRGELSMNANVCYPWCEARDARALLERAQIEYAES
jgi:hypothetical protein